MAGIEGNIREILPNQLAKLDHLEPYAGKVSRPDADTVRIGTRENTNSIVVVNNEEIDVSGNIDCAVGAAPNDLIEGGAPAATTQYYVYLQNTAAGGPRLRLSATAPTNAGYRTGDANSRLVGTVYLDGAKQVANNQELAGIYQKDIFEIYLTANYIIAAGGAGYYSIINFGNLVYLANTILSIKTQIHTTYIVNPGSNPRRVLVLVENNYIGNFLNVKFDTVLWNDIFSLYTSGTRFVNFFGIDNYDLTYYYIGAGTMRLGGHATQRLTFISIERKHII